MVNSQELLSRDRILMSLFNYIPHLSHKKFRVYLK